MQRKKPGPRMASDGWSKRFDEPIVLNDGTELTTLRDAIPYLARTVPQGRTEKVLSASDHLTRSAEQGYPLFFARAATLQAIHRNKERVFIRVRLEGAHLKPGVTSIRDDAAGHETQR
jgi:hypothetical protein